ncbi:hypothetical protein TNCV_1470681 [Trichonephila clavipes]|nr:hypothetical protein TNCV_1470681 [Trichonephila clavipes]
MLAFPTNKSDLQQLQNSNPRFNNSIHELKIMTTRLPRIGGVETIGSERCHLHEDRAQDALDRPVVEKTAAL